MGIFENIDVYKILRLLYNLKYSIKYSAVQNH